MSQPQPQDAFMQELVRLRANYMAKHDSTNLFPPTGHAVLGYSEDVVDGIVGHTYWYNCDNDISKAQTQYQAIRLVDIPGTCSGDMLRLERSLLTLDFKLSYEIIGDEIRQIEPAPQLPSEPG